MDTFIPSTDRQRIVAALIDFGLSRDRTHWVTLNSHRDLSNDEAMKRLKRWRVEMLRRLHGQRFYRLPDADQFAFFGSIEYSQAGHPHFHLACAVPPDLTARFLQHAEARWLAIVASGTCHIETVSAEPDSPRRILGYAFKHFDSRSDLSFVDSRLFG